MFSFSSVTEPIADFWNKKSSESVLQFLQASNTPAWLYHSFSSCFIANYGQNSKAYVKQTPSIYIQWGAGSCH